MNVILWAVFVLSAAAYLASCGGFVVRVRRKPSLQLRPSTPLRLLEAGAVLQIAYVFLRASLDRQCPVYSLHSALGVISLVAVVTFVALRSRRLEAIGGFVAAAAFLFLVAAHLLGGGSPLPADRWLMAIHITANFLGGGILLIAGCASAFYLWSDKRLRRHRSLGQGPKLPPLESLDSVVHRLLWVGVPLLTLGIVSGHFVIRQVAAVTLGDRVRAVLSIGSWLLLLGVLLIRQIWRWRGRRPAYALLAGALGVLIVIVLYIGRAVVGVG
jgi:ABC-type uncharacterized transport system permease subunit